LCERLEIGAKALARVAGSALSGAFRHCKGFTSQDALAESSGKAPEIGLLVAQSLTAVGRYEDAAQVLREFLKDHADRRETPTARRWLEGLTVSAKIRPNSN